MVSTEGGERSLLITSESGKPHSSGGVGWSVPKGLDLEVGENYAQTTPFSDPTYQICKANLKESECFWGTLLHLRTKLRNIYRITNVSSTKNKVKFKMSGI